MDYFWHSELAYSLDKRSARENGEAPFIRHKAFIGGKVLPYDRMDEDFRVGGEFYTRSYPDLKFLGAGEIYEIGGVKQGRFRNMNVNEKYCVTIEDVYGVPFAALSAPQGYEFTGEFRALEQGDYWLSPLTREAAHNANRDPERVRLILRAVPTVESVYDGQTLEQLKEKAQDAEFPHDENWKFEWTGDFRKVEKGEYFLDKAGTSVLLNCAQNCFTFTGAYRLIMRKCPTIKEIYGKELSELTPPKGYEFGEFRKLKKGDDWLSSVKPHTLNQNWNYDCAGDYRLTLKKVTTVEDVYGAPLDKLTPPIGYRFTGEFRNPTAEDDCLCPLGGRGVVKYAWIQPEDVKHLDPRLILEKLPANPTIKDVYGTDTPPIPKGWKFKEFRQILDDTEKIHFLGAAHSSTPFLANYLPDLYLMPVGANRANRWRIVLEKDLSTLTCTKIVTVKDAYGYIPEVPSGYLVIDFRRPETGDVFLDVWGEVITAKSNVWSYPHLILSPLGPR